MSDVDPSKIEFPPVGSKNLVRLGEDLLQAYSILNLGSWRFAEADRDYISSISSLISRGTTSPTSLSSGEAAALTETFRQAISRLSSPLQPPSFRLWLRLHTHALLLEPRIFPNIELLDESPDYMPAGFADIWKGTCHGKSVCVKAIRTQDLIRLREIKRTYHRKINDRMQISHPNVLPIINVSETLFPFCIVSPWMPDGNIIQYTNTNPDANRLTLVAQACLGLMHLHGLGVFHGAITPNNILITRDGQACLADFGIMDVFRGLSLDWYKLETVRYMAPERFSANFPPEIDDPSKESDAYSLAMTSFEVLTGILPFGSGKKDNLIIRIRNRERPSRPTDPSRNQWLQDCVWDTITTCWSGVPEQRHELSVVYGVFSAFGPQETLVEFPPVSRKNLIPLAEDLLHSFVTLRPSILPLDPGGPDLLRAEQEYVSTVVLRPGAPPGGLSPGEAVVLTGVFYKAMSAFSYHGGNPSLRYMCFRLYTHALLRESQIFPNVELCDEFPDCTPNGFADTWKGNSDGELVSIKAIRTQDPIRLREVEKTFRHGINGCKRISHPNVLPVMEVSERLSPFCIMSSWMPDGNIVQYVWMNPGANRLTLLAQACQGLMYLHGLCILHGSITSNNILITRDGQACLADFGIAGAFIGPMSHDHKLGTLRYMAPERFLGDLSLPPTIKGPSKASDVYSFVMTSFEVFTGILPYDDNNKGNVITDIRRGKRPSRPTSPTQNQWLQDPVWDTITTCWSHKPQQRCELSVVYHIFSKSGRRPALNAKLGLQQRGKILPRIASFFQSLRVSEPEIERLVNEMDKRLEDQSTPDRERLKLLNRLCKTCSRHHVIPKSMLIPDCSKDSVEVERGGFANVSQGTYKGRRVALKVMRVHINDLDIIRSRFCQEGVAWKHLRHPNILPLLGVTVSGHRFAMVSEWMEHGNINEFVKKDKHVNRTELLVDVASGLIYMHDLHIVHGDLKGANILINKHRRACLADFGLSTITGVATHAAARASKASLISNESLMPFTSGGTRRWMSPELLDPEMFGIPQSEGDRPTRQSDCYALGMVIYEVLCGHHPYVEIQLDTMVIRAITGGIRPKKPEGAKHLGFSDELWKTVELCWQGDRNARPRVADVHSCLHNSAAPDIGPGLQHHGRLLPRITSFFRVLQYPEQEIERSVDEMDKRLEDHTMSDRERLKLLNKLCKTCSQNRVIPKSMHIPDCLKGTVEIERGGFTNVSQGIYQGRRMAIKVVRICLMDVPDVILSRFCGEAVAWKHLRHPNVLPLLGVTVSERRFAMVSEWMEYGNINEFIEKDKRVNRAELLAGVANGLAYMHGIQMVHGDVKGSNILINKHRRACLHDFGLSTITGAATHVGAGDSQESLISIDSLMSFTVGGTYRWMSPELLDPEMFGIPHSEGDRPTRQSDCYALGMVIYEVLCGHHPYVEVQSDIMVVIQIMEGVRPMKPEEAKRLGFSDELWRTIELCWLEDRDARPIVQDILSSLKDATAFWDMRDL